MIKKTLIGLAAVLVLFLVVVAMQPGEFKVSRSATLAASTSVLFEQVNDHRKFAM